MLFAGNVEPGYEMRASSERNWNACFPWWIFLTGALHGLVTQKLLLILVVLNSLNVASGLCGTGGQSCIFISQRSLDLSGAKQCCPAKMAGCCWSHERCVRCSSSQVLAVTESCLWWEPGTRLPACMSCKKWCWGHCWVWWKL